LRLELLLVPDERLRQKSEPASDPTCSYIKELAKFMLGRLNQGAVAFAAPQFGEMIRLFVARVWGIEIVFVNPEITKNVGEHTVIEGCLSIPDRVFWVRCPKTVKVKGFNLDGRPISMKEHDFLAQVFCHEIDHLDGVLIDEIGREVTQCDQSITKEILPP